MAGVTLVQAQAQLDAWLAASIATASGQSYTIGPRSLTRANAAEIRLQVEFWETRVLRLTGNPGGGIRVRGITPNW